MKDITLDFTFTRFSSLEKVGTEGDCSLHLHPITADNGEDLGHEQGRVAISCNINLWLRAEASVYMCLYMG